MLTRAYCNVVAGIVAAQDDPADSSAISGIFNSELATEAAQASSATLSYTVVAHFPYGGGSDHTHRSGQYWQRHCNGSLYIFRPKRPIHFCAVGRYWAQEHSDCHGRCEPDPGNRLRTEPAKQCCANRLGDNDLNGSVEHVFSLFDFGPNPPRINWAVGAQSTAPSQSFRFAVSIGGPGEEYNAGMALSNPNVGRQRSSP